jgi:hypothetical protein
MDVGHAHAERQAIPIGGVSAGIEKCLVRP